MAGKRRSLVLRTAGACLLATLAGAATAQTPPEDDRVAREAMVLLEGYAAYKMGEYKRALQIWLPLAEAGNPNAMLNVSNVYEQGHGVPADPTLAADWMRRAAETGYSTAQLNYGLMLERGRGVARDLQAAGGWFEKAALQGDREAAFNLGVLLMVRGPENASAAKRWLLLAAERGHPQAGSFAARLP